MNACSSLMGREFKDRLYLQMLMYKVVECKLELGRAYLRKTCTESLSNI